MDFKEKLEQKTNQIEQILRTFLPKEEGYQKTVLEAMNYSILAGGKRIRPLLLWETYHLCGGQGRLAEPFMAAVEMIHTYSLVHDDLPAMDNDDYRRGRETTHIRYGHAMGILAGDALLNYAFETMLESERFIGNAVEESYGIQLRRIMKAMAVLAKKAGVRGMIGGQTADVEATQKQEILAKEKLTFIYRLKTSALIEGAMMAGAILSGADEELIKQMEQIASDVGLAFQIQDDILDVTSTAEVLGKPIFSDEQNQKMTYVTMEGLEKAKDDVERISNRAIEKLSSIKTLSSVKGEQEFLTQFLTWLMQREK